MKGNLKIAQDFEDAVGRLWDGDNNDVVINGLVFSCDAINKEQAKDYLDCVAPGLSGYGYAFGKAGNIERMRYYYVNNVGQTPRAKRMKIQMMRALWLTLLAELAERGEEF